MTPDSYFHEHGSLELDRAVFDRNMEKISKMPKLPYVIHPSARLKPSHSPEDIQKLKQLFSARAARENLEALSAAIAHYLGNKALGHGARGLKN